MHFKKQTTDTMCRQGLGISPHSYVNSAMNQTGIRVSRLPPYVGPAPSCDVGRLAGICQEQREVGFSSFSGEDQFQEAVSSVYAEPVVMDSVIRTSGALAPEISSARSAHPLILCSTTA